jgi:hypothetical protein
MYGFLCSCVQETERIKNYIVPFIISREASTHKVLIYIEHLSVCPLVGIGTPPSL